MVKPPCRTCGATYASCVDPLTTWLCCADCNHDAPPAPTVTLERWCSDMADFLRDFEHDTGQDHDADPVGCPAERTPQDWLDALLEYRDATGAD